MKADILSDGTMVIEAETQVESFALRVWADDFFDKNPEHKYPFLIKTKLGDNNE